MRGITPCIPPRARRRAPATNCKTVCKLRHRIENVVAKLKDWRRIAVRYDRSAHTFFSAICIAAAVIFWRGKRVLTLARYTLRRDRRRPGARRSADPLVEGAQLRH